MTAPESTPVESPTEERAPRTDGGVDLHWFLGGPLDQRPVETSELSRSEDRGGVGTVIAQYRWTTEMMTGRSGRVARVWRWNGDRSG